MHYCPSIHFTFKYGKTLTSCTWNLSLLMFTVSQLRGWLGSQTGCGKNIKRPFLPFLSSFFFVSNRPWVAQNQAAHVAIAKTPQWPVRLCHNLPIWYCYVLFGNTQTQTDVLNIIETMIFMNGRNNCLVFLHLWSLTYWWCQSIWFEIETAAVKQRCRKQKQLHT